MSSPNLRRDKADVIRARIDPELKRQAMAVLDHLGMSVSDLMRETGAERRAVMVPGGTDNGVGAGSGGCLSGSRSACGLNGAQLPAASPASMPRMRSNATSSSHGLLLTVSVRAAKSRAFGIGADGTRSVR